MTKTKRLPAAQRRRQLLDVALQVFASRGFHGTSMEDIADAAGVTKPVLYQHFTSKRALYRELLDDVGDHLVTAVAAATVGASGPRAQVEAGFGSYFGFVADHRDAFGLLFGAGPRRDAEFAAVVRQTEETLADLVAGLIEADLGVEHRRQLGYAVVGLAEGVSRHWLATGGKDNPAALARRTAALAWAGLRAVQPDAEP